MHPHPLYIALTAFDVLAVVATVGSLACWLAVLPETTETVLHASVRSLLGVGVVLITLSSIGILISRTLEMDGGSWAQLLASIPLVLKFTHYGHIWLFRVPALALLWTGWAWSVRHRRTGSMVWSMAIAMMVIAFTRSETGHPADHGDFTFAVWVDWVHLLSGSVWVGSLFGMSLTIFPKLLRAGEDARTDATVIFQRLSTLSGYALAVILVTGIFTAWQELQHWSSLWTSAYGRVLDVKVFLVMVMIGIGAHNRYAKLPRLLRTVNQPAGRPRRRCEPSESQATTVSARHRSGVVRSCARAVNIESLLGVCVIIAAAALLHGMPPADMRRLPGMSAQMTPRGPLGRIPGHDASPVSTGPNEFTLDGTHSFAELPRQEMPSPRRRARAPAAPGIWRDNFHPRPSLRRRMAIVPTMPAAK